MSGGVRHALDRAVDGPWSVAKEAAYLASLAAGAVAGAVLVFIGRRLNR